MFNDTDVNDQYQKLLGRDATKSELADFKRFQGTGYVDLSAEDLGNIIQSHPEYQLSQLKNYGGQYSDLLGQSDQRTMNIAGRELQGQFASQGRNPMSSGYVNAFAQAAQSLAAQRQNTLAQYYGQGFNNIMGNQVNVGQQAYNQGVNSQGAGVKRQWDIQDYYRQKNDYNDYLNQTNRQARIGAIGSMAGGLLGGAGGLMASGGNPMVGMMGAGTGSKLGGSFGMFG